MTEFNRFYSFQMDGFCPRWGRVSYFCLGTGHLRPLVVKCFSWGTAVSCLLRVQNVTFFIQDAFICPRDHLCLSYLSWCSPNSLRMERQYIWLFKSASWCRFNRNCFSMVINIMYLKICQHQPWFDARKYPYNLQPSNQQMMTANIQIHYCLTSLFNNSIIIGILFTLFSL
jgi:hypothetical protein